MAFEEVRFHAIPMNSTTAQNIIGFISGKYYLDRTNYFAFNSIALYETSTGKMALSFPQSKSIGKDYFFMSTDLRKELFDAAIDVYYDWRASVHQKQGEYA